MSNSKAFASASFKKKDGTLTLSPENKHLVWKPDTETSPSTQLVISVESITNLQATPSTSAKVMIKVFVLASDKVSTEQYVFTFTSPSDARLEATQFKDALTAAIQSFKSANGQDSENNEEAVGNASSVKHHKSGQSRTDDDLKNDMLLQQAVLSSSSNLQKRFHKAVVEGNMSATQFWSTRTHLLRAHAAERAQSRGSYNVLATIKPKAEDSVVRVSLSRDQIHIIFEQHPLIKRVYDEVVPKLREDEFWRRLFLSKLYKKLKGEKIVANDGHDDVLDQYLKIEDSVPYTIDITGNEENHSQRQGNRPDLTMRPNRSENVPIIRTLNGLSAKLLDGVTPVDQITQSMEQESRNVADSRLADLEAETKEHNILLNVRDHRQFLDVELRRKTTPSLLAEDSNHKIVDFLPRMFNNTTNSTITNLSIASEGPGHRRFDDGESQSQSQKQPIDIKIFGDAPQLKAAAIQISSVLDAHRSQSPRSLSGSALPGSLKNISPFILDQLLLTQATSTEFLRHFWDVFLSGDGKRTLELRHIIESLKRSLERIEKIAQSAEEERLLKEEEIRRQHDQRGTERKKSRKGIHANGTESGYEFVKRSVTPQERAINVALARYQQAIEDGSSNV